MTGVEDTKGSGGEDGTDIGATDNVVQKNGASEKAPVVAGTNMETLPRPGKQSDPSTAFLRAARAGQLEKVLEFLESGVDINASNANGLNALHLAAKDGHLEIVRELLKRGATVDAATKKGNTALHIASLAGQEEVVQLLVQKGASVNAQSQNGFTPLYMAAQENHDSVVKFLLSKGANQTLATEDGFTPLAVAMQQGHDKVVAVLLENDTRGKVRLPALHIAAKKDDCKAAALLLQNDHNPDVTSKSGFTPLHIAAHYGNDRIASLLYEKGADVNFAAKHNITPMHVAAKWGKIKMVNLLMSKGANISAKTRDGLTPLHCAARAGHHEVVDILIEKGAPIGSKTKNGLAPLHMASQGDHVDAARILLYHRAPVDEVTVDYLTALHVAAHCGHVRVAKLLLDRNADPNARALNGFTPLHIACKKNRIKVVELLLKHKASIEATTESGLTPLHVASFMGCMNIVIYLLQNEASPDIPTVRGETPLHLAARANQTDIIRILLRNGAQVDARAREEQTPLHVASRLGNVDIVMLLLQHGADVDATTKDLYTPLHIAAKEGQEEVASVLLENGASLTATTKKGFTPLHLAAKYGNMNVARLLLQKNAPVDAQGKNGVTPLHVASHYDHQNVALLLLDKGASPHAMAKNGHTPLHIAARKNQMDIATTLLEYGAKANAESKAGFTPLHLSAQEGHTDMSTLLIEHKADTNHQAKNGLTPLHLCAQEDKTNVATILVKNGAQVDAKTKAGYTPLHVAAHFGQAAMVRFLLRNGAGVSSSTGAGYTPLHQAAQQGHTLIINLLLDSKAKPNATTNNGQTALAIAQKLGYISVVETLKVVTETVITTTQTITIEEKYKVQAPESMQETFMSDSEDEGGGDEIGMATMNVYGQPPHAQHVYLPSYYQGQMTYTREDPMLSDQQQYRYMTVDDMKSMGDDSMRVNVTDDEKDNRHSGGITVTDMITKENYSRTNAVNHKPDNIDIHRHPVHVGPSLELLNSSLAALGNQSEGQGMWRDRIPQWKNFLVSFLVDARGGAMRGCRHSGVRVIVPPRKAAMPMRVTCRYLKRDKLTNPPPLMEGEALASRILELGPVGAKFLGPVIIEVPHFASLRGKEREIVILRSDNGETWREHTLEASEEAVQDVLNESFEGEELSQLEDLQTSRIVRILTVDFPHYFAVVSRIRQEVHAVGPEGGTVSSSAVPQVQAVFPPAALTKKIRVGLQAHPIPVELVAKLLGNRVAVSPIVTVEPRRRKFHKPITLTIPVPQAANKGMINQYSGETPTLRLLCSITGGQSRAVWEDVTGSTPLQFVKDCVSFTTTVSARFWLMDCRNVTEATKMATELYTHATHVPFMAKFVVFAKRIDPLEARLRVFCMTDDKEDKTLEHQEHFTEVAKSRDVEVLEGKTQYMEFAGNLVPVLKSGEQLQLPFRGFKENRVPFTARVKDPDAADMVGRIMFMSEPKVAKGEPPQTPICTLNILLPEKISPDAGHSELDLLELSKNYSFLRDGGISRPDTIHRATIRLTDIANLLDRDWEKLAEELNISPGDVEFIKNEHPEKPALQAATMFKIWQSNGNKATGNTLEKALNKIGREDIVKKCIFNVELVTDDVEKAVARVRLDQPGFDSLKEELGPSRDSSLRRDGTLGDHKLDIDYEEPDRMKDSESIQDLRVTTDVSHKQTKPQHITINGTAFNGTSTPIKDKYAGDEKELRDDMADFLEYKCHTTDTMTKIIRDEADDDIENRKKIIEDANRLVTGVLQDAEKEKEKLAKQGWSGVYHDDASKEAEGAIGKIEGIIVKESIGRGGESIEPIIVKKHKTIVSPDGTIVSITTKGDPDSALNVDRTKTIEETITMSQAFEKPVVDISMDLMDDKMTKTESNKAAAPLAAIDTNITTDHTKKPVENITRIQIHSTGKTVENKDRSGIERASKDYEDVGGEQLKKGVDAEDSLLPKSGKLNENAYEIVYNVDQEDPKSDEGKKKDKGGIFSSIFKGPKTKESKSKRDSKDSSFDSGEEDIKITKEFLDQTRKVADKPHESPKFEYPAFDPSTYIAICPQKLPENEPNRDTIWATADFLYDSRRSAEAFVPERKTPTEQPEIRDHIASDVTTKSVEVKKITDEVPHKSEDHKEKHGFFSGLFKGSKKHDTHVDSNIQESETTDVPEKIDEEVHKSLKELKHKKGSSKDSVDSEIKLLKDEVNKSITNGEKISVDDVSNVKKKLFDDKKYADEDSKSSSKIVSTNEKMESSADKIRRDSKKTAEELNANLKEITDDSKNKPGGFFGIFKSPKSKNRRSRSRDTSKDVSFDSGDEELRTTTAVFLDDTRKAADRTLLETITTPELVDNDINKVEKFITEIPEKFEMPKDSIRGSSYNVTVSPITESGMKTATTTMKPLTSDEESSSADQSLKQKSTHVSRGTSKLRTKDSSDREDSADEAKHKSSRSFFGKFKSPKLRTKSKSRSRDRSTSTEPSFDSGDEELRITTSKFLNENRKIAEQIGEFDEATTKPYDSKVPIETKEATKDDSAKIDIKSEDDDGKHKGGFFGIFKSPKSAQKRSKSQEKRSSAEIPLDGIDEELKITTQKLLADTRHIADLMDEHPYPSAPTIKSVDPERTRDDHEQDNTKAIKKIELLPGISDTTEKVIEDITHDIKEVCNGTKEEVNVERGIEQLQQVEDKLETPKAKEDEKVEKEDSEKADEVLHTASGTDKQGITEKTEQKKTDSKISPVLHGKSQKTTKTITKPKESTPKSVKKETTVAKGKNIIKGKSSDLQKTPSHKPEKDPEKSKEKGAGFLSDIIKGAKHAVDEISEDVKEFWVETKEEAQHEEEQHREKDVNGTAHDTNKKKIGDVTPTASKGIKGKAVQASTKPVRTTTLPTKNGTNIESKKTVVEQSKDSKTTNKKGSDTDKVPPVPKGKAPKGPVTDTSKKPKDDMDKAKAGKQTTDVKIQPVKQLGITKPTKSVEQSTVQKSKTPKVIVSEKVKSTKPPSPNVGRDLDDAKKGTTKQVKKDVKSVKSKVDNGVKASAVKDPSIEKEERKKSEEKDPDLFSSIINNAKHSADEVTEDIKKFDAEIIGESKDAVSKEIDERAKNFPSEILKTESSDLGKNETIDSAGKIETVRDPASNIITQVSDTTDAAAKKVMGDLKLVKEAGYEKMDKSAEFLKNEIEDASNTVADTAKTSKGKVEREAKKSKDKAKGFLSGIFKGPKHGVDETIDNTKNLMKSAEDKVQHTDQKITKHISGAKEIVTDSIKKTEKKIDTTLVKEDAILDAAKQIGEGISSSAAQASERTHDAAKKGIDDVKEAKSVGAEKMKEQIGSLEDKISHTAVTIDDAVEIKKDEMKEEATKDKEKTKGFFSGIFKGAKHEVAAAVKDGKDIVKKTGDKIEQSEQKIIEQVSAVKGDTADTAEKMKDGITKAHDTSKEAIIHTVEQTGDVISRTAAQASEMTQDAAKKVIDDAKKTKSIGEEKTKKQIESLESKISDTATTIHGAVEAKKEEIKEEATKEKEKAKGFFSGIFEGAKYEVTTVVKDGKDLVEKTGDEFERSEQKIIEQVSEVKGDIADTAEKMEDKMTKAHDSGKEAIVHTTEQTGDVISRTAVQASEKTQEAAKKVIDDLKEVKSVGEGKTKGHIRSLENKIADTAATIHDAVEAKKGEIKEEVTKEKEKTKGFFSGIFKGAKHEVTTAVKDGKDVVKKAGDEIERSEQKITEHVSEVKGNIADTAEKMKDEITKAHDTGREGIVHTVKRTGDVISRTAAQASRATQDTVQKMNDDVKKLKDSGKATLEKQTEGLENKISDAAATISDTVEISQDNLEEEATKAKEKTKGFFSGIFKGVKHGADEGFDETKSIIQETGDKIDGSGKRIAQQVSDRKDDIEDSIKKMEDGISQVTSDSKDAVLDVTKKTSVELSSNVGETSEIIYDDFKKVVDDVKKVEHVSKEKIGEGMGSLKDKIANVEDSVKDSVESSRHIIENKATKAKDKSKGFFGIFKGAKHEADETVDNAKNLLEKNKNKIESSEQKIVQQLSDTKDNISDGAGKIKDEISNAGITSKDFVIDAAKQTGNVVTSTAIQASQKTGDISKNFIEDLKREEEVRRREMEEDAEYLKNKLTNVVESADDTVKTNKDKIEKEMSSTKEKTKGFFSGIFKGGKREADEVADHADKLIESAENKIEHTEQKIAKQVSDTAEKIKDDMVGTSVSSKNAALDSAKRADNVITSTTVKTSAAIEDTAEKIIDKVKGAEEAAAKEMRRITDATDVVTDSVKKSEDNIEQEKTKVKEKSKGFFSGIFKGAKHEVDEAADDVKDSLKKTEDKIKRTEQKISKQVSDTKGNITGAVSEIKEEIINAAVSSKDIILDAPKKTADVVSNTAEQASELARDVTKKMTDDVKEIKDDRKREIETGTEILKNELTNGADGIIASAEASRDEIGKETLKVKEKTMGFGSEALKGVKHEADEVLDDTKALLQTAEKKIKSNEEEIAKQLSDRAKDITNSAKKKENEVLDIGSTTRDSIIDAAKRTGDVIASTGVEASQTTKDITEKFMDDLRKSEEAAKEEMKKDAGNLRNKLTDVAESVGEAAEKSKDKIEKTKEKTKGFFSGILKGAKHDTDRTIDSAKDLMKKTEGKMESSEQRMMKQASDMTEHAADIVKKIEDEIVDGSVTNRDKVLDAGQKIGGEVSSTIAQALEVTEGKAQKVMDNIKDVKNAADKGLEKDTEKLKHEISDAADTVTDKIKTGEDRIEKEAKKGKEKTKGFFSGIFKTVKHETHKAVDDAKDNASKMEIKIIDESIATKDALLDTAEKTSDGISKTVGQVSGEIQETSKTIIDDVKKAKDVEGEKMQKDAKNLINDITDASRTVHDTVETSRGEIEREATKAKEKTKGFFSGIFKGAKHEAEEAVHDAKTQGKKVADKIEKKEEETMTHISEAKQGATDALLDVTKQANDTISSTVAQASEIPQNITEEVISDLNNLKDSGEQKIKGEAENLKKITDSTVNFGDTVETVKDKKEKEATRAHEKSKGFFSGIFKGVKHTSEEAIEDTQHAIDKTKDKIKQSKQSVSEQVSDVKEDILDATRKTKGKVIDTAVDASKTALDDAEKTKIIVSGRVRGDVESVQGKLTDVTHDAIDAVKARTDEFAATTGKVKETRKDVFSGVFKESKHAADEVAKDFKKLSDDTQDAIKEIEQKSAKQISDKTDSLTYAAEKTKDEIMSSAAAGKDAIADTLKATSDMISSTTTQLSEPIQGTVHKVNDDSTELKKNGHEKDTTKTKQKTKNFFSGILEGAKHAAGEVVDEMKEFIHETEEIAKEDEQKVLKQDSKTKLTEPDHVLGTKAENINRVLSDSPKRVGESSEKVLTDKADGMKKDSKTLVNQAVDETDADKLDEIAAAVVDDISKDGKKIKLQAEKSKHKSSPIFGILKRSEVSTSPMDEGNFSSGSTEHMVDVPLSTEIDAEVPTNAARDEIKSDNKKKKDKGGNFLSGIIKGAKHAIDEVSEDVKEFWDETKQSTKEEDVKFQPDREKTTKHKKEMMKNLESNVSTENDGVAHKIGDDSSASESLNATISTVDDSKLATQLFLEDTRASAVRIDDKISKPGIKSITSDSVGIVSTSGSSPEQTESPKSKSKSVISSIVKGAKSTTEKFWEDTKHSGSYDISSPQTKTDISHDKTEETQVKLKSFGPVEVISRESSSEGKSVSCIPQKTSAIAEFDEGVRVVSTEIPLRKEIDNSDRDKSVGHLEPHSRQTVTTIVTKSSTRTTMSTPPPSPDELGDSRIKDVTEEAAKRAQSIAEQAHGIKEAGHDLAKIDGTVERHVSSTPTMSLAPDPSSLKKKLNLNLGNDTDQLKPKSLKSKIPHASKSSSKSQIPISLDTNLEESDPKNEVPVNVDNTLKEAEQSSILKIVDSASEKDDTMIPFTQTTVTQEFKNNEGQNAFHSEVYTSLSQSHAEESLGINESTMNSSHLTSTRESIGSNNYTEVITRTIITERIPASTSKEDGNNGGPAKESISYVHTQSSWESSTRLRDNQDNWDQRLFSSETSPDSVDVAFTKNSDSHQELPSDSDSDGSPRTRRRSLSKRRTIGSSSGSDVALHEGAELSPLEDDQESDFMQHSEPSYVEQTTTEFNPMTNERITRTTRVTTTAATRGTGGNDELRESMQKIVDQFMTEERRAQ